MNPVSTAGAVANGNVVSFLCARIPATAPVGFAPLLKAALLHPASLQHGYKRCKVYASVTQWRRSLERQTLTAAVNVHCLIWRAQAAKTAASTTIVRVIFAAHRSASRVSMASTTAKKPIQIVVDLTVILASLPTVFRATLEMTALVVSVCAPSVARARAHHALTV